ncbi:MAG: geranylgeranyl reductase family protein [Bacteroidota bacterium]
MTTDADVIISGAGPAGSIAAYELARRGVSVLLLEKSQFPRYKVCGGGLTHKILQEIPFDVSTVFETQIHTIVFSSGFKEVFARTSPEPMIYCTMRDQLDAHLLEKAIIAGARVRYEDMVMEVKQDPISATVITRKGILRSKLVIGADGATSAVARSAGLSENIMPGLAWEAEVKADTNTVKAFSKTVFLDWGAFPGGYGWVFPKGDHFSIGVGGPASLSKWMMPYYKNFIEYLDTGSGLQVIETTSLKSWPIPVRIRKSRFHNGRILVAGDAGGLTDPLTGEGIYYAIRSGKLAAATCYEYLQSSVNSLESYSQAVNDELMNELVEANRIKFIFNTAPLKIHRFVRDNERAWRAFGKVLRGERMYADVKMGFGKWKFLWSAACMLSRWISEIKEKQFSKKGFK